MFNINEFALELTSITPIQTTTRTQLVRKLKIIYKCVCANTCQPLTLDALIYNLKFVSHFAC